MPGGGSLTRLPRQIHYAKAMEILLVGDSFSAPEVLAMGLLNYVVPRAFNEKRKPRFTGE